ncbi:GTPase HflX [Schlesneria sp. DSM 10557]|uniref:GTPase HflX n=1 Tax=Schlesneria sp. DSM 10557 TaxID=3044399 RepID=UPI0035A15DFC
MAEPIREDLKVQNQTAVLVSVPDPSRNLGKEQALDELKGLVKTAGVKVVGELVQRRGRPHPGTCLGSGKIEELKDLVDATGAKLIIFDNNLTPAQGRYLEQATKRIIVDRSELILDIFATHARTAESRLQVELAQLQYTRTRLKRMWTHLERIEGGIGASRGPGEKQIETDRRIIDQRIDELKTKLAEVEIRRERMVRQRESHPLVSLVGYTNAGKSTLMNALTGADVYVADQLFATLDTRTRKWSIPAWGDVLLSDTVGFVRDLPHSLIASFKSTLEEARQADLLMHVVDVSNPEAEDQVETVERVLDEIGVERRNFILVLNKIDAVRDRGLIDVLRAKYEHSVTVSALTREGFDKLGTLVGELLGEGYVDAEIVTSAGNGKLFAFLAEHAEVTDTRYEDSTAILRCRIARNILWRVSGEGTTVRVLSDTAQPQPASTAAEGTL